MKQRQTNLFCLTCFPILCDVHALRISFRNDTLKSFTIHDNKQLLYLNEAIFLLLSYIE